MKQLQLPSNCDVVSEIRCFPIRLFERFHSVFLCLGEFHRLIMDLRVKRKPWFFAYFRMTPDVFDELVKKLTRELIKQPTRTDVISVPERVAVTLRYNYWLYSIAIFLLMRSRARVTAGG